MTCIVFHLFRLFGSDEDFAVTSDPCWLENWGVVITRDPLAFVPFRAHIIRDWHLARLMLTIAATAIFRCTDKHSKWELLKLINKIIQGRFLSSLIIFFINLRMQVWVTLSGTFHRSVLSCLLLGVMRSSRGYFSVALQRLKFYLS